MPATKPKTTGSALINLPKTYRAARGASLGNTSKAPKEEPQHPFEFNREQDDCTALLIRPVEQTWRVHLKGTQNPCAAVAALRTLPNDLSSPPNSDYWRRPVWQNHPHASRRGVRVPNLFFPRVVPTAPSNRAARGSHPSTNPLHAIAGMEPQYAMRTSSLGIKRDRMRKRIDANQTDVGVWVHDEALQTCGATVPCNCYQDDICHAAHM